MTKTSAVRGRIAGSADIDIDYLFSRLSEGLEWQKDALCSQIDPEMWFPEDHGPSPAKRLCGECLVKQECLDYAIENNEMHGIWGGMTRKERRKLALKRQAEAS